MNFKEHATGGIISSAICSGFAELANAETIESLKCGAIAFFFSLFPDVDTQSHISKFLAKFVVFSNLILIASGLYLYAGILGTCYAWLKMGKHRGWTHSYFLPVLFFILAFNYVEYTLYFISLAIGLLAHYFIDGMNPLKRKEWVDFK